MPIKTPYREMTLSRFGGMYTEADAPDLPLGASPLNHDVDFQVGGVGIRPGLTKAITSGQPGGSVAFQYLKSTQLNNLAGASGAVTLAQSSDGKLWEEFLSSPGSLGTFYPTGFLTAGIINGARALSESTGGFEFIALSNFLQGTDQPRTYDGTNLDRVSQCAPISSLTVTSGGSGSGQLAAGPRYAICMFLMRNGYITRASAPVSFSTAATDTFIQFNNLPQGNNNPAVAARILAVTAANAGIGGPYYYVPNPAPSGFSSTVVQDALTASLTATLSDAVITAGVNVATTGNNRLNVREVGEYVKAVLYGQRVFYLGERAKIDNLYDLTFDGGNYLLVMPPWTFTGSGARWLPSPSIIYGQRLEIQNTSGSTLNTNPAAPTDYASTSTAADPFGVPTLRINVQYSVRVICYTDSTGAGAKIGLTANLSPSGTSLVATPALTTTPKEFTLNFNVGAGFDYASLWLYPISLPTGGNVYVERIEIFPTSQPVYQNQLTASYIQDYQSIDSQTGPIGVQLDADDYLTNEFRFLDTLYFTSTKRTFQTQVTAGSEPSGWTVSEVSNTIGSLGPAAEDVGEEYVLLADRRGIFEFDGGNHVKISQEIQQLWDNYLYTPSASQTWIKNDLRQKRILVGVAMVTPNPYLPDAPPNATPSTPNVILMCSYLGLDSGSELASSPGVHTSAFTGQLLDRDLTRKWTAWYIASPYSDWVNRADGSEQLWLGGTSTGQIYKLDPTADSDDGAAIKERYMTYGFNDETQAQTLQLGSTRLLYTYLTLRMDGAGGMVLTTYPQSPVSPYADSQPAVALSTPALDDINLPLNETGNALFLDFQTDGKVGSFFTLHRAVLGVLADPRIPVTGL